MKMTLIERLMRFVRIFKVPNGSYADAPVGVLAVTSCGRFGFIRQPTRIGHFNVGTIWECVMKSDPAGGEEVSKCDRRRF